MGSGETLLEYVLGAAILAPFVILLVKSLSTKV
jgi:hypothetical protein